MADNTTLNTGTGGDVIATDDISGVKYQRVKIVQGADGVNDGDVSSSNPLPIDGTVSVSGSVAVTDNGGSLTVDGTVTASQASSTAYRVIVSDGTSDVPIDAAHSDGEANTENHIDIGAKGMVFNGTTWDRMRGDATNGTLVNLGTNNDVTVTGTVTANAGTGSFTVAQATAANLNATVTGTVTIQDGGNSITVDNGGTFAVQAAQSGNYVVRNQDGSGNNLASSTTTPAGTEQALIVRNIPSGTQTISGTVTANAGIGTMNVSVQNSSGASAVNIQDGGNSITVDGTVSVTDGLNIEGDVAHDSVDSGNPVKIGFQAENSFPAAVATGDRANGISDLFGRQLVAHVDAGMQVWKGANYITTQTGTDIWTPSSGKKICTTYLAISSYGTTAARVIIWLGASADTTYTAGTDQLVWAGSFAPSANSKPGAIISLPFGITAVTADHRLKITTDAAISLDLTIYGYEC